MTIDTDRDNRDPESAAVDLRPNGPSADEIRSRRRRFLTGSLATGTVMLTLANRPALAGGGGGGGCTLSAAGSINPSHPISGACGDSPGCWKNKDFSTWADGATFNGVAVPYTHGTNITSVFTILKSAPFTCSNSTLQTMLVNANSTITIKMTNNTSFQLWSAGQERNIVAAILNNEFYGAKYSATNILTVIGSTLSNCKTLASQNKQSSIQSAIDSLDTTLNTLNNQGEVCAL